MAVMGQEMEVLRCQMRRLSQMNCSRRLCIHLTCFCCHQAVVVCNKTFPSDLKEIGDLRYLREIKVKLDHIQINLKVWLGKHSNDRLDHTCD